MAGVVLWCCVTRDRRRSGSIAAYPVSASSRKLRLLPSCGSHDERFACLGDYSADRFSTGETSAELKNLRLTRIWTCFRKSDDIRTHDRPQASTSDRIEVRVREALDAGEPLDLLSRRREEILERTSRIGKLDPDTEHSSGEFRRGPSGLRAGAPKRTISPVEAFKQDLAGRRNPYNRAGQE